MKSLSTRTTELLIILAIREIKIRYKNSILGPLWIIIHPLSMTLITSLVFYGLFRSSSYAVPYPIFALSGLIVWSFFTSSIMGATKSLLWNRDLVTKSVFNKAVIPFAFIVARSFDFSVNLFIFLILFILLGYHINYFFLLIPILFLAQVFFACAVGLLSALANAFFRDIEQGIDLVLFLLFYSTPIIYPADMLPASVRWITMINPVSLVIEGYRHIFFQPSSMAIFYAFAGLGIGVFCLFLSLFTFQKYQPLLGDIL